MIQKLKRKDIELIVYDCDGVLTDNKVILCEDGKESAIFNRSDGLAVRMIKEAGIAQVILSTEKNKIVKLRSQKLKIPVIYGVENKKKVLQKYCRKTGFSLKKTIYVGNDINDLDVMRFVGMPMCPLDAFPEIKRIAKVIIQVKGGEGVVRELLNYLEVFNGRIN